MAGIFFCGKEPCFAQVPYRHSFVSKLCAALRRVKGKGSVGPVWGYGGCKCSAKPWNRPAGARGRGPQPAGFRSTRPFSASARPNHHGFAEHLLGDGGKRSDDLSITHMSTAAGICTGAAAQKCTAGSVVACPRSPWEGPARGATRPPRGWRRPARGRGVWAHAGGYSDGCRRRDRLCLSR